MIVAFDAGTLLQLADGDPDAWNLYDALVNHDGLWGMIVPPATVGFLDYLHQTRDAAQVGLAAEAWRSLQSLWQIKRPLLDESQRKLGWILAYHLLSRGLLAEEQRFEAELFSEAALLADVLVVQPDSSLLTVDAPQLQLEMRQLGFVSLILCTPQQLRHALRQ